MSNLTRNALATLPLEVADVEEIYAETDKIKVQRLCESHERLRAELKGAMIMLDRWEKADEMSKMEN